MYVDGERVARATSTAPTRSTGPLLIGATSGGFVGRIDHLKVYDGSLTEKEVRADAAYAGPVIALSGAATEPLPEPPTGDYELQISATDGAEGRSEPGVTGLGVSVDSTEQKAFRQGCAASNCPFTTTWQYTPLDFPGFRHTLTVTAEDKAGVLMGRSFRAGTAAENIRTCTAAEWASRLPLNRKLASAAERSTGTRSVKCTRERQCHPTDSTRCRRAMLNWANMTSRHGRRIRGNSKHGKQLSENMKVSKGAERRIHVRRRKPPTFTRQRSIHQTRTRIDPRSGADTLPTNTLKMNSSEMSKPRSSSQNGMRTNARTRKWAPGLVWVARWAGD